MHDIDNPIEDCFFSVDSVAGDPVVLVVGILHEGKNTLGAIRVAEAVRNRVPNVRFRLAGPWSGRTSETYRQQVLSCHKQHGLESTVDFLGFLDRNRLLEELSRASCLFLPSFQENAPMVIAEAMAAGVPVAASRICGIPYMVEEGKTGFLFDPNDEDEMADRLCDLFASPDLRKQMGQAAKQVAENRFRADRVAKRTIEVYKKAIDRHRG